MVPWLLPEISSNFRACRACHALLISCPSNRFTLCRLFTVSRYNRWNKTFKSPLCILFLSALIHTDSLVHCYIAPMQWLVWQLWRRLAPARVPSQRVSPDKSAIMRLNFSHWSVIIKFSNSVCASYFLLVYCVKLHLCNFFLHWDRLHSDGSNISLIFISD